MNCSPHGFTSFQARIPNFQKTFSQSNIFFCLFLDALSSKHIEIKIVKVQISKLEVCKKMKTWGEQFAFFLNITYLQNFALCAVMIN